MIFDMSTVALAWIALAASFVGLGSLCIRSISRERTPALHTSFWLGWAIWIGTLQLLHFFVALDGLAISLPLFAAGGVGLAFHGRAFGEKIREALRENPWRWMALAIFATWLCNRSLGPLLTVDAGLYHLGSIKWAAEHPLVGGLANLHGRLAFNSSAFLWMASLDGLFGATRGFQLASPLLVLAAAAERVARGRHHRDARHRRLFEALLLLPLGYAATVMHLSNTGPDWIVLVLGITAASMLFDLLSPHGDVPKSETALAIAAVLAAGVTVKLSFAVLAAGVAVAAVFCLRRSASETNPHRVWVASGLLVAGLAIPWLLRGIELSGYPAYPLTWFAPGVEWQLPAERAEAEVAWIRSWARAPDRAPEEVLGNFDWFGPWLRTRLASADSIVFLVFPALLALAALVLSLTEQLRSRVPMRQSAALRFDENTAALFPFGLAVVAWFVSAPDPRFLGAALWVLAACWVATPRASIGIERLAHGFRVVAILLFALYCGSIANRRDAWWFSDTLSSVVPTAETRIVTTRHGLALHVPVRGQQCWEAPLPCTPYPAPRLGLRHVDDPWSGYRLIAGPSNE